MFSDKNEKLNEKEKHAFLCRQRYRTPTYLYPIYIIYIPKKRNHFIFIFALQSPGSN